jgi:LmbE family N-acetylglucosaminyl deacetylase
VFLSTMQNPDVWIDVSGCFDRKLEGLRQHTSQVGSRFDQVTERIRERSRQTARQFNLPFEIGEGFRYFRLD